MIFSKLGLSLFVASAATYTYSFSPIRAPTLFRHESVSSSPSSSSLYISSWGKVGLDADTDMGIATAYNPERNIQSYLEEPDALDPREKLEGTVMVSGLVNTKERTDQFVFDLLNHEESAFEFERIVAFVDDAKFSKKRLLSRSARYTGLLDKLDFAEAETEGALPTIDQLKGINSWLATVESKDGDLIDQIKTIAALAKDAPALDNISVMVTNAAGDVTSAEDRLAAVEALRDTGKEYTLLVMGMLEDRDEGKIPYKIKEFASDDNGDASLSEDAVFSRDEAMRMITETLQLEAGAGKALTFSEVYDNNATEAKLIKGLREAGYARAQEIDHLLRNGTQNYQKALDEFREKNPNWDKKFGKKGVKLIEPWWEEPEFLAELERQGYKGLNDDDEEEEKKDDRTLEIEKIATEWAKREYFSQSMAGTVKEDMTEEAFIESVWERALFEGDLKYRQMSGEEADVEAEMLDFKAQQERKQQTVLKKAKKELQEVLDEDNLGPLDGNKDDDDDDK